MSNVILPERLLDTALELFASKGFDAVAPIEIAQAAQCNLDDLFRYFPRKERFILRLYERLTAEIEGHVPDLPAGSVGQRFVALMDKKLTLLEPHWQLFRSLLSSALDPSDRLAVLGPGSDRIRRRIQAAFASVVYGANDAPPANSASRMVRFLYAAHLGCIFCGIQDQTENRSLTRDAVELVGDLSGIAVRMFSKGNLSVVTQWAAAMAGFPNLSELVDRADQLASQFIHPPHDSSHFSLAENILRDLFRHRRLHADVGQCSKEPCPQCLALHLPHVESAIAEGVPIHLVLPAFPCKSASPRKVVGSLPDLGEELSLRFLQERCDAIAQLYPPGARLTICSDGRVFNDLVGVDDDAVTAYGAEIAAMIQRLELRSLDTFNLDEIRPDEDFNSLREWLVEKYAEPIESLVERTAKFEHHQKMYNGIHRFLTEDLSAREPSLSKTQARQQSKQRAYEVIQRSNAWSRLLAVNFPDALRLSIHPQSAHAEKIGILLTPTDDAWLTPWHGTILIRDSRIWLTHRSEAESSGAQLVERDGRPSHFELVEPLSCVKRSQ